MKHPPRTVIITGASSGIGLALAEAYLARGDNVIGNARTAARLQAVAAKLASPERFVPVVGDIADPATAVSLFERAIAEFGGVDILINNAGIFDSKPFAEYSPATIDAVIDTNLRGFVHASQQAIKHMQPRKAGHIINISASIAEQPLASVPATLPILVKGGINSATKSLAIELAPYNIKVSAVAPGIIDTPLFTRDLHSFLHTLQPLGRMGSTADIVAAVMYLTDSDYSTGVILPVDGGMSAGHW